MTGKEKSPVVGPDRKSGMSWRKPGDDGREGYIPQRAPTEDPIKDYDPFETGGDGRRD